MRPEGMLDRLAPLAHLLRMLVEPALHGFENMLVLPSRDPSLLGGSALMLDGAALAGVGPVAAQDQSIFLVRVAVGQLLTGRTDVDILIGHIAEVLLAEAAFGLGFEVIGFGSVTVMPPLAGQDLLAAEVAAVGNDIEILHVQRRLRLLGHVGRVATGRCRRWSPHA